MTSLVNRGFTVTLVALAIAAEVAVRAAAGAPPRIVRILYGTTLAMYMAIEERLAGAAPEVRVLVLGDSLALTQFQPDTFAGNLGMPPRAVFNASYLAQTFRSHESLLTHIGVDRLAKLARVLIFVNPRRLTPDGNEDAAVFRVAVPEQRGTMRSAWEEKSLSPILDRSRLYGLSRYVVSASWRQIGRPPSWDGVEYLTPQGGVSFEPSRPETASAPGYVYTPLGDVSEEYVGDLRRLIELFRRRGVGVVLLTNPLYRGVTQFADVTAEQRFAIRMQQLAADTGSVWLPVTGFQPPADTDFLDYGHLNRSGGVAFTRHLIERLSALPPIE